jgi:ADP-heptose:LPS heptosyltransferase
MAGSKRILVIRFTPLGEFVLAMGPFAAIRAHHPEAKITLLTAKPLAPLAEQCPYFDDVWIDDNPRPWEVAGLMRLRKKLRSVKFDMVYDLQTSERSSSYIHILGDPPWSGTAHNCSHPHANPDRELMHIADRQAEQLVMAGIATTPSADLSWVKADAGRFFLPARYALMVPGGVPHRPSQRWPADRFGRIANDMVSRGVTPVLLGTGEDEDLVKTVTGACRTALSLVGRTDSMDVVALARDAAGAVGNDSGAMHLIAAAGCPSVVLFSADTDPNLCAPRGLVTVLRADDMADLTVDSVRAALTEGAGALRNL